MGRIFDGILRLKVPVLLEAFGTKNITWNALYCCRNVILDETNVNGAVQANKWRLFDGYKRLAVVVVTSAETLKERHEKRSADDVLFSERTITEMKGLLKASNRLSNRDARLR